MWTRNRKCCVAWLYLWSKLRFSVCENLDVSCSHEWKNLMLADGSAHGEARRCKVHRRGDGAWQGPADWAAQRRKVLRSARLQRSASSKWWRRPGPAKAGSVSKENFFNLQGTPRGQTSMQSIFVWREWYTTHVNKNLLNEKWVKTDFKCRSKHKEGFTANFSRYN